MGNQTAKWSLLLVLSIVVLTACLTPKNSTPEAKHATCSLAQKQHPEGGKTLTALRERGTLKVGFSSFAPWAMQDANGEWIGLELDVMHRLVGDLRLELELVPVAWPTIIDDLLAGKFDIIIGGMVVNTERAKRVQFSIPYEFHDTVLLLNRRVAVNSLQELNQPQYRFAGLAGYSTLPLTRFLFGNTQIKKVFDDDLPALQYVASNQADAFLTISAEAAIQIARHPDTIYMPDWGRELAKENAAFALPKGVEAVWLKYLNEWIQTNWANGFLEEKNRYWMGSGDWIKDHQLAES